MDLLTTSGLGAMGDISGANYAERQSSWFMAHAMFRHVDPARLGDAMSGQPRSCVDCRHYDDLGGGFAHCRHPAALVLGPAVSLARTGKPDEPFYHWPETMGSTCKRMRHGGQAVSSRRGSADGQS